VIRLIARSTVEEIILKRAEDKLRLTEAVIVAGQSTSATGVKGYNDELKVRIMFHSAYKNICFVQLSICLMQP